MTTPQEGYPIIDLRGESADVDQVALEAIFSDPHTLASMEAHLKNTDKGGDREKEKARRVEALAAFSQNPPAFWDMIDG